MAQSLTVRAHIYNATTGGKSGSESFSVTTAGDAVWAQRGSVGTTEEEWTISTEVGNCGLCTIRNYDSTNFVDIGFATTVYPLRLKAGQSMLIALAPSTASLFLKADTAACVVGVEVIEA